MGVDDFIPLLFTTSLLEAAEFRASMEPRPGPGGCPTLGPGHLLHDGPVERRLDVIFPVS